MTAPPPHSRGPQQEEAIVGMKEMSVRRVAGWIREVPKDLQPRIGIPMLEMEHIVSVVWTPHPSAMNAAHPVQDWHWEATLGQAVHGV